LGGTTRGYRGEDVQPVVAKREHDAMSVLVGTQDGLLRVGSRGVDSFAALESREITWLTSHHTTTWLVEGGRSIWRGEHGAWRKTTEMEDGLAARCVLATRSGVFVGTSGAHLFRLEPNTGELQFVDGFEAIEGRAEWSNPGGREPDTRSLAEDPSGRLFANVHVGGIATSADSGATWHKTSMQVAFDVHEVLAPTVGTVLAATGYHGLCTSKDGGLSWTKANKGLPPAFGNLDNHYCRAVALVGNTVLITASTGPRTVESGIYRKRLDSADPFERCRTGLPETFTDNINTGCLVSHQGVAVFGSADGSVFTSSDEGRSWNQLASSLPRINAVTIDD